MMPVVVTAAALFIVLSIVKEMTGGPATSRSGIDVKVGTQIPDYTLQVFPKGTSRLSEIKKKVILINFWASWCEACISEMPSINALRADYKDRGFEVLGINLDEKPEAVVPKSVAALKMLFPVFVDPEAKIADDFDVHAIPFTVVVDADRRILAFEAGERDWNSRSFRSRIEDWLGR